MFSQYLIAQDVQKIWVDYGFLREVVRNSETLQEYQNSMQNIQAKTNFPLKDIELQVGSVVYMLQTADRGFYGNDYQRNTYNSVLGFIVNQGEVTLDTIMSYYRENIRSLIAQVVEDVLKDKETTISASSKKEVIDDITAFFLNPSEELLDVLISSNGKYWGTAGKRFNGYNDLLNRLTLFRQ
jgi:hypothetical protein